MKKLTFHGITYLLLIVGTAVLWQWMAGKAKQSDDSSSPNPAFIEQEMMMLRNPYTDEINTHLRYKTLGGSMSFTQLQQEKLRKQIKYFPYAWLKVNDFFASLAITKITFNPQNPQEMYFCTGEGWFNADASRGYGVWKSVDGGANWQQLSATLTDTFYYCQDMVVHPSSGHLYVATREGGLQRSTDGGLSFQPVLSRNSGARTHRAADIEIDADGNLWVSFGIFDTDGIYFSDSGNPGSWEQRTNGLPANVHRIELAVAPSNPNRLYCIPTHASDRKISGVYRSDDRGLSWQEVALPGGDRELAKLQGWYDLIIEVDPNNEDVVVCGGLNLYRSRDGGNSWQQLCEGDKRVKSDLQYVHVDQHEVVFINSDEVYFTNDGGIYRCDSFRADTPVIYSINDNYNVTQYYTAAIYPKAGDPRILGGTQDNGTYRSTAAGISDFENLSWADGGFCEVNPKNEVVFTTTQLRRIYRFREDRIDTLTNPALQNSNTLFINPLHLDPVDPEILFQASNIGLWRLKNASEADSTKWERACAPTGQISAIGLSTKPAHVAFVGLAQNGLVYRLENAHNSTSNDRTVFVDRQKDLPPGYVSCIEVDETDANHVLITFTNYGISKVWESFNALSEAPRWRDCNGNLPDLPVRWAMTHPSRPGVCWLGTENGVYYTDSLNGMNTRWYASNEGLANLRISMLRYRESDQTIIAATHGRGLYTGKWKTRSNEIDWNERGPRNIGGRTRTILQDPNDPAGRRFWAGSVSGGLWFINDIDSSAYFEWREELTATSQWRLFPNPLSDNQLKLKIPEENTGLMEFRIYNINGQLIWENQLNVASQLDFQVPELASGIYFFSVSQDKEVLYTTKFVKTRP